MIRSPISFSASPGNPGDFCSLESLPSVISSFWWKLGLHHELTVHLSIFTSDWHFGHSLLFWLTLTQAVHGECSLLKMQMMEGIASQKDKQGECDTLSVLCLLSLLLLPAQWQMPLCNGPAIPSNLLRGNARTVWLAYVSWDSRSYAEYFRAEDRFLNLTFCSIHTKEMKKTHSFPSLNLKLKARYLL